MNVTPPARVTLWNLRTSGIKSHRESKEKKQTNKIYTTMQKINFNTDDLLRELAGQYAKGLMTTDQYLDLLEEVCRRSVTPAVED